MRPFHFHGNLLPCPGIAALIVAAVVLIRFTHRQAFHTMNQGMDVARVLPQWYFDLLSSPSLQAAATPALLALAASAICVLFCRLRWHGAGQLDVLSG